MLTAALNDVSLKFVLSFGGLYVDELASVASFGEFHSATDESIEGVILTDAHVQTGVVYCSALTLEDVAGFGELAAENFNAESFAF